MTGTLRHISTNDVWYCGEIARNYETFEGDDPEDPELVDIDGSWKAGRDGAKPGILIQADPQPPNAYRQEVLLGEAEDVAQVLSNTYVFGSGNPDDPNSLDYLVPEDLADALCSESRTVRGHPGPHGARAGRGRAQVLRPRDRCVPGGESRDGRDSAARRLQLRFEM